MLIQLAQALDRIRSWPGYTAEMSLRTPGLVYFIGPVEPAELQKKITEGLAASGLQFDVQELATSPLGSRLEAMISEIPTAESEPPPSTP